MLEPKKVRAFETKDVRDVCAGQFHSLALTIDNELYAWGKGQYGRLGTKDRTDDQRGEPSRVILNLNRPSSANNSYNIM